MMALGRAHRAWGDHMRSVACEIGIPDSYRTVIMFLSRNPGANQKNIAEFSNKTTAAVNQTVKEMIAEGYVEKETDTNDRRYTRLYLTEKGSDVALKMRERLHDSDEKITSLISLEKEEEMIKFLDMISDLIRREM